MKNAYAKSKLNLQDPTHDSTSLYRTLNTDNQGKQFTESRHTLTSILHLITKMIRLGYDAATLFT